MKIYYGEKYAGMGIHIDEKTNFYYGVENKYCQKHKTLECDDKDCDDNNRKEDCFIAQINGEQIIILKKQIEKKVKLQKNNIIEYLLAGIAIVMKDKLTDL